MVTQIFLLEMAHNVNSVASELWNYDDELQMNTVFINDKNIPVCTTSSMITGSKTDSAPGDDDPDPDVERMY
ncbi:TPA: hypothetical protein ACGTP8_004539 [Yersinia enterocolitica]|uniref:hypothetical protein n=1 Tax=Yersinia massiliensis TaxID=419257 RepID=UPI0028CFEE12|nr:hypothetical protein [Yersinia massiliensis]